MCGLGLPTTVELFLQNGLCQRQATQPGWNCVGTLGWSRFCQSNIHSVKVHVSATMARSRQRRIVQLCTRVGCTVQLYTRVRLESIYLPTVFPILIDPHSHMKFISDKTSMLLRAGLDEFSKARNPGVAGAGSEVGRRPLD